MYIYIITTKSSPTRIKYSFKHPFTITATLVLAILITTAQKKFRRRRQKSYSNIIFKLLKEVQNVSVQHSMSWFGGGKKSNDNNETDSTEERGFSDNLSSNSYSTPMSNNMYGGPGAGAAGSSSGLQEFQEFSIALQQQVLVQTVITDLTQKAFSKCCSSSTTSNTLTGKEAACISAVTNKWLDSNEFLAGRLQRKQQQQGGSSF
jgi:hypothetical protein